MFKATVLSLLAATQAEKQKPLVMSVSGGGIPSFTSGMAVARALKHMSGGRDALSEVTHLGGNSGGSWFNNLFLHSQSFFDRVVDESIPMDKLVEDWLHVHLETMAAEVNGSLTEFGRVDLQEPQKGGLCHVFNPVIREVFKLVRNSQQLPERLLPLMAGPVLKEGFGPDKSAATATFEDFNHTLPGCTQISVTALPPDAWTNYNKKAKHIEANQLHAFMKDGSTINFAENGLSGSVQVAFVSDGPNKHEWYYGNEDIEQLQISPKCPYTGLHKRKCKHHPYKPPELSPLPLNPHPTIAEVMVASGSATCFAASPAIWERMSGKFNDWGVHGGMEQWCKHIPTVLKYILQPVCDLVFEVGVGPFLESFEKCWPFGAQSLASPMMKEGVSVAESEEAGVPFRYCDGAYAENTAIPMTLSKVQRDCEQGLYDCSEPIKVILVNHGNVSMDHQGPTKGLLDLQYFNWTNKAPLRSLFAEGRPDHPEWVQPPSDGVDTFVPGIMDTVNVPSANIFEEVFPEKPEWETYLTMASQEKHCRHCTWVEKPIQSLKWEGEVTTVDNKWYGIKAGMKVQLLVFSLELPSPIWPQMFNEDAKNWASPGHILFGFGAAVEDRDSMAGHAPYAKAQLEAVKPVLEAFLNAPGDTAFV
jgi:hypothetical protein